MNKISLVFTSANSHKVAEINQILGNKLFSISSLSSIGFKEELPETSGTFMGNAKQKAEFFYRKTGLDCFSDDSGLVVEALQGAPGVNSATYAGEPRSDAANIEKLLNQMAGIKNRKAFFICVICLVWKGDFYFFEGRVDGEIAELPLTNAAKPFGYDPVFIPEGFTTSFAQMMASDKDSISHRSRALTTMQAWFNEKTK